MWESVTSQVSHSHGHMTGSHSVTSHDESHDRHGKIVHRPCSSCISSVENLMGTLLSSPCNTDKGAVGLILALELASLTALKSRKDLSQTSFGHISTNSLTILMVSTATESP